MDRDRDRDQSRDDKTSSREKQTLPRGRGSGSLQLENLSRQQLADISRRNFDRFTSAYFAWRKSKLPLSSFKYPIMEPYPFHLDDRYTVRTPFFNPRYNENETGWQQGLSLPSSNTRDSNLALEQKNMQYHYQPEAFAGVNVWMDGLSSSSSLNFPSEPPSNQRIDTTNLRERARMDGSFMFRPPIPIPSHNDTMAQQTNERNPQESNSEAFAGYVQMDGSSSSSSLNFPIAPLSNQRYLGNCTTNLTEEEVTSEIARHQGLSLPPWNYQESNLGLEQTDQIFDDRLEAFLGVNVQMEGSSSSSSLNFPEESPSTLRNYATNLPEEARRSYPASSMFSPPSHNEPGIARPQGMVPPQPQPWNPQESDLDQLFDYPLEALAGVNVQMDGSSLLSSLQFPTEPPLPSNQRYCGNYTTNYSEEATTFGYRHLVAAPTRTDISASRGNLNIGHFSSQDIGGEGGPSSSQEPNPKKQKMKENAFTDEDLYMLTRAPSVSTRMYQSSNPSASAQMDSRHEYPVHRSVPTRVPTNLPPTPSLHRQCRGSG